MATEYQTPPRRIGFASPKLIAVGIWVLLVGSYAIYYRTHGLTLDRSLQQILALFDTPYGPLLYLLSFFVRPFLFFSVGVLCIMGGAIFGAGSPSHLFLALGYTVIGVICSASISFGIGRFFGYGLIVDNPRVTAPRIHHYVKQVRQNGFLAVLSMRLLLLPFDFVNYVAGLTAVDWRAFLFGTAIGSLPSTLAFVSFGAALDISQLANGQPLLLDRNMVILALCLFVLSFLISRWYKGRPVA
ncbi:MAG: TVP38/TMEM64 family protein [Caldilineaceae bacterium]|nr:TVP38/TMEM64 family protein [Caldilineaceae bacterium]